MISKGFDDWIEIFRGGKREDSKFRVHDGDKIIDKALASFDPAIHEPPLTMGHPKDNSPAYGWVSDLKEATKDSTRILFAKFKQVDPEVNDMAKKGHFKKRSSSFYPDGRLQHVSLLGGAIPAVRGLKDILFIEDETAFSEAQYEQAIGESIAAKVNR